MKSLDFFDKIFVHRAPVDMRKSINGLSVIVDQEMGQDIQGQSLFIFCNKRRTHLKMLYFDKSGFALWLKRLEVGKFPWSKDMDKSVIEMEAEDLELLLDGVNVWTRFEKLSFERVI
jgi:transposase